MSRPLILFDLTRLLSASGRSAPTGIERVEFAYARWLLSLKHAHVRFVVTMNSSVRLVADSEVPAFLDKQARTWARGAQGFSANRALANVNHFLQGGGAPPAPRLGYMSREERLQRRQSLTPDRKRGPLASWAQQMAANWAREPLAPLLQRWARRRPVIYLRASLDRMERAGPIERIKAFEGVKMVTICHDIIPLDFPEFVRPNAVALCAARVETMAQHSDGIIVSSRYSAHRLAPFLQPHRPRVMVAHIGMDAPPAPTMELPDVAEKPFFLVISTIEARKNHLLLLNLWRRLAEDLGPNAPKLVIVGKRGWEAQTPIAMLDRADQLSNLVYEAGAVPDNALDALRRKATAVLMPSFVEGFGMPVAEALAVDTPVIASDIPVFRETTGDAAELIDPLDGPAWRQAILDYADPASPRRAAAVAKAKAYTPPSWESYFDTVGDFLDQFTGEPAPSLTERARRALGQVALDGADATPTPQKL
ncbi:glycosyltransferase family 4 protein [Acuticoccus kandeliae]|uniref:glycosyltransferase family 4 protein n=1 Tax=Acuticoccus kandeliae TaxID=2073160 RepID=UPI001300BBE4|nr:glycosyltransferase family 1 protein [Acuticoccus kandeliae]